MSNWLVWLFAGCVCSAASLSGASLSDTDAQALLKQSDAMRNGWSSYVGRVKITNYESGKADEEHFYQVSQKGVDKTHVEFLSPREKGTFLLMLGDDMWVYLPDTSRPVRITPLERLTGDTSNGDVARTNYAYDYDALYLRREKCGDTECHVLELTAKRKASTYHKIEYWLRVADARPVKAEFYLTSGKHIKSATFDEYRSVGGATRLVRMTLYDQIRKQSHSVLQFSDFQPRELPDKLFHQGRLDRF
ncbi:MAG: outer membrane lipoprotein-sorting protein [Bryobacteraceae bacterium]